MRLNPFTPNMGKWSEKLIHGSDESKKMENGRSFSACYESVDDSNRWVNAPDSNPVKRVTWIECPKDF
jgi:hypothetical protein